MDDYKIIDNIPEQLLCDCTSKARCLEAGIRYLRIRCHVLKYKWNNSKKLPSLGSLVREQIAREKDGIMAMIQPADREPEPTQKYNGSDKFPKGMKKEVSKPAEVNEVTATAITTPIAGSSKKRGRKAKIFFDELVEPAETIASMHNISKRRHNSSPLMKKVLEKSVAASVTTSAIPPADPIHSTSADPIPLAQSTSTAPIPPAPSCSPKSYKRSSELQRASSSKKTEDNHIIQRNCCCVQKEHPEQLKSKAKEDAKEYHQEYAAAKKAILINGQDRQHTELEMLQRERWLVDLGANSEEAFCEICQSQIRAHKTDLIRHTKSKLHLNASSKINVRPGNQITKHMKVVSSGAKVMDLMIEAHIACHSSITSVDHLEDLLEDVSDAKYSPIVDESTDVTTKKYLCLCIRYFSAKQCDVKTDFLVQLEVEKVTAEQLYLTLTKYLKTSKPDVENLVGLGTYGANNLCERNNSLFTLLRADSPNLQIVKCIYHSLNAVS
ncbi:unnamed protein product [Phaedon cochleariae]|uniref:Uncharacterized protein n=1 Tax=Phaedon cochleariae TaxID=80249 RepID=A0A9N9SGZ3_PHACE|nr:unnamed protein product [Phaedon cochleariae]